jgi:hypothetical protein
LMHEHASCNKESVSLEENGDEWPERTTSINV